MGHIMLDDDDLDTRDRWRMRVGERLVRLETGHEEIKKLVCKNNSMTEDIVDAVKGLKAISKVVVWLAATATAGGAAWASFSWVLHHAQ